jgi:MATE family multidrug resistance protein
MTAEQLPDDSPNRRLIMPDERTDGDTPPSFWEGFFILSRLAIPMLLSYTFSLQMLALIFFSSRENPDKEHEAAITMVTTLIFSMMMIGISPLFAMSIVAGKHKGKLDTEENPESRVQLQKKIAHVYIHGVAITTVMALIVTPPLIFSEPIVRYILRQTPNVAELTQNITRLYAPAFLAALCRVCPEQMMFSFAKTLPPMCMGLFNAGIGFTLSYVLGFGAGGAPNLKERGIIIGYIVEAFLTLFAFTIFIALSSDFQALKLFRLKNMRAHFHEIQELLKIGGSILIGNSFEVLAAVITGAIAGGVGVREQAAYSNTMQFMFLASTIQAAFSQTTVQEMIRRIGAGAYHQASALGKIGISTTLIYAIPVPLLFSLRPEWLMRLLGQHSSEIEQLLTKLVPIMSIAVIPDAISFNLLQQLRTNLDDGVPSTAIAVGSLVVGLSFSGALGLYTSLGINGVALGYVIGKVTETLCLAWRWKSRIPPESIRCVRVTENPNAFFAPAVRSSDSAPILDYGSTQSAGSASPV